MNPTNDIHDIKGLVPVPHSLWWLWLLLAVIAGAAAISWVLNRRRTEVAASVEPPPSPYDVAMRALQRLREDQPPVEQFYMRLSDIVRHYLEGRFSLRAPERTTEEFLYEVSQNGTLSTAHKELLGTFLQESDLVKFARHQPQPADQQRVFAAAERFVEETRSP
jgi:hypothetical protein